MTMITEDKPHTHPFDEFVPNEARQHMRAARDEMRQSVEALFPPGFIEHRRAARKEMLKAARSFLDNAIQRLEQREQGTTTKV
jgi:hypothetical protein